MKTITLTLSILTLNFFLFSCGGEQDASDEAGSDESSSTVESVETDGPQAISFESEDGLEVSANLYEIDESSQVIVLCHQARFNKYEYAGIAERLNELGFNCMAIDQRSGGPIAEQQNETNNRAQEQGLGVDYLDAIQDISAAVDFASDKYGQDVILWGSSYSSTLVLWEALSNEKVKAVVSFSPGDYFTSLGSLTDSLTNLSIPCFLTAADFEIEGPGGLNSLTSKMTLGENQTIFAPDSNGHHGSRALWPNQFGGEQYWNAITPWLETQKN